MRSSGFFFFFQAEDGIRDVAVTGVQTCALPISPPPGREVRHPRLPRCGAHGCADAAVGARARGRGLAEESQGMRRRRRRAGCIGASLVALLLAAGGAAADYPPPAEGDFLIRDFRFASGERSEEHTSELQSRLHLVCRLLLEKKKNNTLIT